jgi:hypothetical protein
MAMRRIFWSFCINRFGRGPLHYVSSRSDFGFEFVEIFVIEKRLPNSPSRGVDKIAYRYNFFKQNKSMVIVYYIHGFFFDTFDLLKGWFSCLKFKFLLLGVSSVMTS